MKNHKFSVELKPDMDKILETVKKRLHGASNAGAIRHALRYTLKSIEHELMGGEIVFRNKDKSEKVVEVVL